jgi:hypothetical protein
LESEDPITAKNPYDPPSTPGKPDIVDYDNKSVTLNWKAVRKTLFLRFFSFKIIVHVFCSLMMMEAVPF